MDDLYLYSVVAWFIGGIVNGITGFGAALVCMPILTMGLDLSVALPSCTLVVLLANTNMSLRHYRDFNDWRLVRFVLLGAVPGALAGVWFVHSLPELALRLWFGTFLLVYSLFSLLGKIEIKAKLGSSPAWLSDLRWSSLVGFVSTSFGTTLGFHAPPLVIYCNAVGMGKNQFKSTLSALSVATGIIIVATQAAAGFYNANALLASLVGAPAAFVGSSIGLYLTRYLSEEMFRKLLYLFLLIMGASIVYRAVPSLLG